MPGLEQYAVRKFVTALESFPKAIADNSGINGTEIISKMYLKVLGVDIESQTPTAVNVTKAKIYDLFITKYWALKYAVEAAATVLRVNQIIMAKRAGGPKPRTKGPDEDED